MRFSSKISEKSILIADEHLYLTRLMCLILKSFGFNKVVFVHDFDSAVEILKTDYFDCLVSDSLADCLSGLGLVNHIRLSDITRNSKIPILWCTGMTQLDQIVDARNAGVSEILTKPLMPDRFLQKLWAALFEQREFISVVDYTGPDRRRRATPFKSHSWRTKYGLDQTAIDMVMEEKFSDTSEEKETKKHFVKTKKFRVMVNRAEKDIREFAKTYDKKLMRDLTNLKQYLKYAGWVDAQTLACKIKNVAGTLGWPLISMALNCLSYTLNWRNHIPQFEDVIEIQFETIDLLHQEKMKLKTQSGILLIDELFAVLENYGVRAPV